MVFANAFIFDEEREEAKKQGLAEGREEGREEGRKEGRNKGISEMLIIQLKRKFDNIPESYIEKIQKSSIDVIENLAVNIFDINSIKDLDNYL